MLTRRPAANRSACWSLVNIPWAPEMVGTALQRRPRRNCHFFLEQRWGSFGIVLRDLSSLSFLAGGRVSTCWAVSMAQPSTTLVVLHRASNFFSFLTEIG